jgi:hypothetical protein
MLFLLPSLFFLLFSLLLLRVPRQPRCPMESVEFKFAADLDGVAGGGGVAIDQAQGQIKGEVHGRLTFDEVFVAFFRGQRLGVWRC